MGRVAKCNVCPEGAAFRVPWDEIGIELMKAHFQEKHPEELKDAKEIPGTQQRQG